MSTVSRQNRRAIYSLWDLQQALSALTFLLEDCDFSKEYGKIELRRFRCYETTFIISMARPFESARARTTLGLKAIGIVLSPGERTLFNVVLDLRRKVFAHSDEEEMHYRTDTFEVLDGSIRVPHVQFDEGLHLEEADYHNLHTMLHRLIHGLSSFLFQLAQQAPGELSEYHMPKRKMKGRQHDA